MAFFEIQWRASTKKDLRAIPPHEVERIVAAVEKLSDEPFPYGFQKLTGAAHTPQKNGAKRKLTESSLARAARTSRRQPANKATENSSKRRSFSSTEYLIYIQIDVYLKILYACF